MAKALLGHLSVGDPRVEASLAAENRRLRQRVTDLEAQLLRLQAENDRLVALFDREPLTVPDAMQPA